MSGIPQQDDSSSTTGSYFHYIFNESVGTSIKSHHILIIVLVILCGLLFHFRHKIIAQIEKYRTRHRINRGYYSNLQSFEDDVASGLTSSNFDLEANNIGASDSRAGLSEAAKLEIKQIMKQEGLSFDDARLEFTRSKLNENNIDDQGLPKDPKLVTF
ncbi:hypothetical protein Cantr_01356 [Candida viswanathii]|uniref:Uncharacterized protein n=1 Tax=Candida viswanathii TaxID=5486 RepID=A0A367YI92_9ASCO|nr:hypothetical protein Cantr_01356 [Candida viswanathii]